MEVQRATTRALQEAGIDINFGLLGKASLAMVGAYVEEFGGRFVATAHEARATLTATGYSITTGKTGGLTYATSGEALSVERRDDRLTLEDAFCELGLFFGKVSRNRISGHLQGD